MTTKNKNLLSALESELGPLSFAGFLLGARASLDISQAEMARKLNISRSTLCDIEKGRHLVSPTLAAKIAKKCGLPEIIAITAALQDQLTKAKLKLKVHIIAS